MKAIRNIILGIVCVLIVQACSPDDFIGETYYSGPSYLRFFLVLDSDSIPLEGGASKNNNPSVENYTHKLIKPIKIPVALTASEINEEVTVEYSTVKTGTYSGYTQSPLDQLRFSKDKLIDTIFIEINERWDTSEVNQLEFELTKVSDPSISIGSLNSHQKNKKLTVSFGHLETTYTFPSNRKVVEGRKGEAFEFSVDFPKGFFMDELESEELFVANDGFDYTLTRNPIKKGDTQITYTCTLDEDINIDDRYYESILTLRDDLAYLAIGNKNLQIVKPLKVERDKAANPAAHFYNLNDPYYRTYGEMWIDYDADGISDWRSFTQFTFPMVVDADDPNAVLYSDGGNSDPSDDVYHHAFKVRIDSPNAGRTTNAFGMKYLFNDEYTDADKSPGFNIDDALEFFPKDGTSTTEGTVLVTSQYLTISGTSRSSYLIGIKGDGTYSEISDGLYEIILTIEYTNDELWGGKQEVHYHIYNSNVYAEPAPLDIAGPAAVDL